MWWRIPLAILAVILIVTGAVQGIFGAREVAQERTVAGEIISSSGCAANVQAGAETFPIETCRPLAPGTRVQVTLDQDDPVAVHLGSSEIYASVDTGASNRDDGFRTALAGLVLLLLAGLVSISAFRTAVRTLWLRLI
jgi:hypothetical protein